MSVDIQLFHYRGGVWSWSISEFNLSGYTITRWGAISAAKKALKWSRRKKNPFMEVVVLDDDGSHLR